MKTEAPPAAAPTAPSTAQKTTVIGIISPKASEQQPAPAPQCKTETKPAEAKPEAAPQG